jgi:hypothetical protein
VQLDNNSGCPQPCGRQLAAEFNLQGYVNAHDFYQGLDGRALAELMSHNNCCGVGTKNTRSRRIQLKAPRLSHPEPSLLPRSVYRPLLPFVTAADTRSVVDASLACHLIPFRQKIARSAHLFSERSGAMIGKSIPLNQRAGLLIRQTF